MFVEEAWTGRCGWMNGWSDVGKGEAGALVLAVLLVDFSVIHSGEEGMNLHSSNIIVDIQHVR